jgi:penicillin-binding protein A
MTLNHRIWHVGSAILVLLFLLSLRLVYWQLLRGDELRPPIYNTLGSAEQNPDRILKQFDPDSLERLGDMSQPARQRTLEVLGNISRGAIYDRNGRALAYDVPTGTGVVRFYAEPSLAPVVGYVSALNVGVTGIERALNGSLMGLDRLDTQVSQLINQPITGSDVYLTIDSHVQRTASAALGGRAGAVIALDATDGAVLALASAPSFDPNQILDEGYAAALIACADPACEGALLNRATQGFYTPGSTWKTVTLAAALDSGLVTPQTVFDFGEPRQGPNGIYYVYEVNGFEIIDPNHAERQLDLVRSYAVSANAAFARMGDELGADTFVDYATRFGFGRAEAPPLEIAASPAQLAADPDALADDVLRASTAFGQGELQVSPLSMALVVATIVNDGDMPRPHLLLHLQSPGGRTYNESRRNVWIADVIQPATADQVEQLMVAAVEGGSGWRAALSGLAVGGKTGTAQLGGAQQPHAWFIGFAGDGTRTVAIAVLVEHGGSGAQTAAPIFAEVANAALRQLGTPVDEIVAPPPDP